MRLQCLHSTVKLIALFSSRAKYPLTPLLIDKYTRNSFIMLLAVTFREIPPVVQDIWLNFKLEPTVSIIMFFLLHQRTTSHFIFQPPKMQIRKLLEFYFSCRMSLSVLVRDQRPWELLKWSWRASQRLSAVILWMVEEQREKGETSCSVGMIICNLLSRSGVTLVLATTNTISYLFIPKCIINIASPNIYSNLQHYKLKISHVIAEVSPAFCQSALQL